jgi:general secretion pathway protein D
MTMPRSPRALPAALAAVLAVSTVLPPAAWAQNSAASGARARAPVTVNFVNADIEAVSRAFAALLDRPILVDPRVKGVITVYSEQQQTVREAYSSYQSALRGLGFAVVESGGLLKVVPEADAKLQTGTVSVGDVGIRGDQVITQIFPLRYENPNNLVAVLRPLISANNTINANPGNNALVITDYADNLQRIAKIVSALDQPPGTDVEIIPLQHGVAADLAPLVQRLSESASGGPGVPGGAGVTVVADSRANALVVRAPNATRMLALRTTIAKLDRPNNLAGPGGGMWVVHLKNADAVRLATVVRAAFGALGGSGGGSSFSGLGAGGGGVAPQPAGLGNSPGGGANNTGVSNAAASPIATVAQPSTGGFIQADPATNSLIITAPEPLYKQVRALIDQLDERRAQVYIESMIVEVSGDNSTDFGFQWQGLLGKKGDEIGVISGTNFGGQGNIIGVTQGALANPPTVNIAQGLNLGLVRMVNGVTSLAAILRALQSQAETNIVSTPNLITLDNEEAKIVVGENVPFITGQFTQTGGANTNPFQTIERKDVGITLRIRPQIGENGAIRMAIFQEQSSVLSTSAAGPSTTKRSIENNVVVDDGAILALGGLIEDRFVVNKSKVPLLGDLPFIGALFRSESRERKRTNLMVFLRPVVLRTADDAARLSVDRYEQIRSQQKDAQPVPSAVLPINESPVLPPLRAPTPALVPLGVPEPKAP